MVPDTDSSRREERKQWADDLIDAIEADVDHVDVACVNDATPKTWQTVSLAVHVDATSTTYYSGVHKHDGVRIDVDLSTFANALYTYVRQADHVSRMDVTMKPTPVAGEDNVYKGNLYLLDVYYP